MNHTPWYFNVDERCEVLDRQNNLVAICYGSLAGTNAARIVRAINTHEELLLVAKAFSDYLNEKDSVALHQMVNKAIAKAEDHHIESTKIHDHGNLL